MNKNFRYRFLAHRWFFVGVFFVGTLAGKSEDFDPGRRYQKGEVWITLEMTPEKIPSGAHGGWDFYDGTKKQFWIGSGWGANSGKWGVWSAVSNRSSFSGHVDEGTPITMQVRVDFGEPVAGDESIQVWLGDLEKGKSIASLDGIQLSGFDSLKTYVHPRGNYDFTEPQISSQSSSAPRDGKLLFTRHVAPLLKEKCGGCHGDRGERLKGGFDMRSREGLLAGGESEIAALVPGKPEESPLFVSLTWKDPDLEMPPKENDRLSKKQIATIREWIEAGAPWVDEVTGPEKTDLSLSLGKWTRPNAGGKVQVGTSGGLDPDWTRRFYKPEDLWAYSSLRPVKAPVEEGHPIDAFVERKLSEIGLKSAPLASRQTLLRRLVYALTGLPPSREDGEMAYEDLLDSLLDSPHYGERMAQHWLDVTRYADSNGFSKDEERPGAYRYREYVIDSFNEDKAFDRFVCEQIAGDELGLAGQEALSFLWMGPWEITNMTSAAVARQLWLDDVVNSIGVTFLGQELRCAKCHDHKFDPIPTRDYYAMQAIFAGTNHHRKAGEYEIRPRPAQKVFILNGGALESPGEVVGPAVLSATPNSSGFPVPLSAEGRRAALANWIADQENPFTARVIVNRVWQWYFGDGLVATSNGFGVIGSKPSHPELLDFLADWFVENDWSVKELSRLILTSETYRRDSFHPDPKQLDRLDPDRKFLSVFQPRRLSAEEIRDSMLAVSGELTRTIGGSSFRPEINWEVAFQPRLAMGKIQPPWQPDAKKKERDRRSLYAMRIRNLGHPMMEVLNRPPSELSCEKRDETTVVTQAFSLFHGDFSNARALALAERIVKDSGGDVRDQIEEVYLQTLGRIPTEKERQLAKAHVDGMRIHHEQTQPVSRPLPTEVKLSHVIEKSGVPAYQTFQLENLKNYERDLQPDEVGAATRALAEFCLVLLNSSEFLYVY